MQLDVAIEYSPQFPSNILDKDDDCALEISYFSAELLLDLSPCVVIEKILSRRDFHKTKLKIKRIYIQNVRNSKPDFVQSSLSLKRKMLFDKLQRNPSSTRRHM